MNIDILGISELKWTGMGEFNSDDYYIYYCGQEFLRRNGVAIKVKKRVRNAVLACSFKNNRMILFVSKSVQLLSLCNPMNSSTPGLPVHHQLPEFTQTRVHRDSDDIQPSHPLSPLLLLPPIPPSIKVFSNESTFLMRWPKYWSFRFSIIPSKEVPGLISFRMDWLDLLAVQGTLKSLLQHHSSKASILRCPAFFTVQLSHPYMTTGKIIALTRRTSQQSNVSAFEYAV